MIVARFFEPALAQASYLIGCAQSGDALVIDPTRDIAPYLATAAREKLTVRYVTETHIHADFLSGTRELAHATGATMLLSDEGDADWKYAFAAQGRLLRHADRITMGRVHVDVEHTPGHTPEHLTFLITDGAAADQPIAAATGDFLFSGDVGRPDLLERAAGLEGTMESGARTLWRSLQRFATHEDWLQLWPGHGAGSACGKGISAIPYTTLGYERRFNWAFTAAGEDDFVAHVLDGQPDPPRYFATMKALNKRGPDLRPTTLPPRFDAGRLAALVHGGEVVVDTRPAAAFAAGHVPGTLNLPMGSGFVTWAGWLLPYDRDLYLVGRDAGEAEIAELTRELSLIGLDRVAGVFDADAIDTATSGAPASVPQMAPLDLVSRGTGVQVVDVRGDGEWKTGHIAGALHVPLGHLPARLAELPDDRPIVVQCRGGSRSAIAASLLRRSGRSRVSNLTGGIEAWTAAGLPLTAADA